MIDEFHTPSRFTAERYLLGELTANERERFEEHYFSCAECANEVLAGAAFLDNSRELLPHLDKPQKVPDPAKPRFGWFSWPFYPQAAFAAAALLAVLAGYQNAIQIPRLRAHGSGDELVVAGAAIALSERAASSLVIPAKSRNVPIFIRRDWQENYPLYVSEIENAAASNVLLSSGEAPAANSLSITIPAARLGPGKYLVILYGVSAAGSRQVVGRYPLTIQE